MNEFQEENQTLNRMQEKFDLTLEKTDEKELKTNISQPLSSIFARKVTLKVVHLALKESGLANTTIFGISNAQNLMVFDNRHPSFRLEFIVNEKDKEILQSIQPPLLRCRLLSKDRAAPIPFRDGRGHLATTTSLNVPMQSLCQLVHQEHFTKNGHFILTQNWRFSPWKEVKDRLLDSWDEFLAMPLQRRLVHSFLLSWSPNQDQPHSDAELLFGSVLTSNSTPSTTTNSTSTTNINNENDQMDFSSSTISRTSSAQQSLSESTNSSNGNQNQNKNNNTNNNNNTAIDDDDPMIISRTSSMNISHIVNSRNHSPEQSPSDQSQHQNQNHQHQSQQSSHSNSNTDNSSPTGSGNSPNNNGGGGGGGNNSSGEERVAPVPNETTMIAPTPSNTPSLRSVAGDPRDLSRDSQQLPQSQQQQQQDQTQQLQKQIQEQIQQLQLQNQQLREQLREQTQANHQQQQQQNSTTSNSPIRTRQQTQQQQQQQQIQQQQPQQSRVEASFDQLPQQRKNLSEKNFVFGANFNDSSSSSNTFIFPNSSSASLSSPHSSNSQIFKKHKMEFQNLSTGNLPTTNSATSTNSSSAQQKTSKQQHQQNQQLQQQKQQQKQASGQDQSNSESVASQVLVDLKFLMGGSGSNLHLSNPTSSANNSKSDVRMVDSESNSSSSFQTGSTPTPPLHPYFQHRSNSLPSFQDSFPSLAPVSTSQTQQNFQKLMEQEHLEQQRIYKEQQRQAAANSLSKNSDQT